MRNGDITVNTRGDVGALGRQTYAGPRCSACALCVLPAVAQSRRSRCDSTVHLGLHDLSLSFFARCQRSQSFVFLLIVLGAFMEAASLEVKERDHPTFFDAVVIISDIQLVRLRRAAGHRAPFSRRPSSPSKSS
jgi:hypothetical protein